MPKKKIKSREEKAAEGFFEVDEDDVDFAIEKAAKDQSEIDFEKIQRIEKPVEQINVEEFSKNYVKKATEKTYNKPDRKTLEIVEKKSSKKPKRTRRKTKKEVEYSPPNVKLKKSGYELIITEKPQAASKIASALGKVKKNNCKKTPYYEVDREGQEIVVACAVGHLFTLTQKASGSDVPRFDIQWVPNYIARKKGDFTKRYYDAILKLVKGASEITVATDYDIEGEVIGLNVVRYICNQSDAARMKFSTLTDKELNEAYENKKEHINWGQAIAGESRHYLDWFYGINLSRALMNAIKTTGKFKIMSIGRVQGPALNLIVKKEKEIQAFKPKDYWQIFITVKNKDKEEVELKHNKDIFKETLLERFKDLKGKIVEAETKKSKQKLKPPVPFNLSTLQTEAYKLYGFKPSRTLQIAQGLYLNGVISYPRTSSQKLPASIGYMTILKKLAKEYNVEKLMKRKTPMEGKKSDPAHPSIYPTGQLENKNMLNSDEKKLYDLVAKRFLSLFCEDAEIDNKRIVATYEDDKGKEKFTTKGQEVKKKAWLEIYPSNLKERDVPDVEGKVKVEKVKTEKKQTQPPKRYSPASIVTELEKRNLGTKATRASIVETLFDRGYVKGQSIEATPFGISLVETLEKYSPIIIDEALTGKIQKDMDLIVENPSKNQEKLLEKEEKILSEAKRSIIKISEDFQKNEKEIGKELIQANIEFREQQKKENELIQCPKCKKGNLFINYSKKTRRHFVACTAYPSCTNTYTLPPNGRIKKTDKTCEECGYPLLMTLRKGKRPWIFCFNPECPTNKERIEEYKKRKAMEENNS